MRLQEILHESVYTPKYCKIGQIDMQKAGTMRVPAPVPCRFSRSRAAAKLLHGRAVATVFDAAARRFAAGVDARSVAGGFAAQPPGKPGLPRTVP